MPGINFWFEIDDVYNVIYALAQSYRNDPINVINEEPLEYVANIQGLSYLYDEDLFHVAAAKIRSIIQGHPLQDGNKRFGMLLGSLFLENNGYVLVVSDEDFFETALALATGETDKDDLRHWIEVNAVTLEDSNFDF